MFNAAFLGNPEKLVSTLDKNYPYSIRHFIVLFSEKGQGEGFNPTDWHGIGSLLLDAARISPEIVIPEITTLLTETSLGHQEWVHSFSSERAAGIFGENLLPLMKLFTKTISTEGFEQQASSAVQYMRQYAQKWLKKANETEEEDA